jgi:hypothetical protein
MLGKVGCWMTMLIEGLVIQGSPALRKACNVNIIEFDSIVLAFTGWWTGSFRSRLFCGINLDPELYFRRPVG